MDHVRTDRHTLGVRPGALIQGRYIVERAIGSGGMGRIYLARQLPFERLVALKVMHPQHNASETLVDRFIQEAQIISRLAHPNTVSVYEVTRHEGALCIVMEYVEGQTLAQHISAHGPLSVDRAVVFSLQVAQSLGEAHRKGVVHRDVKPENIMVCSPPGADPFIKVLDFGVAKLHDALARQTQAHAIVGTPHYMSPEQVDGGDVDARADLYSLACCMVEMLTGQPPYVGESAVKVMLQHRDAALPTLNLEAPPALEAFLHRALAKRAEDRPASASQFAQELMACFIRPVAMASAQAPPEPARAASAQLDALVRATHTPPQAPSALTRETIFSPLPMSDLSESTEQALSEEVLAARQARASLSEARVSMRADSESLSALTPAPHAPQTPPPGVLTLRLDGLQQLDAPVSVSMTVHGEQRAQPWQKILIDSAPQGALVRLDGQAIGLTPLTYRVSGDSPLDVMVERSGFEPYEVRAYRPPQDREARVFALLARRLITVEVLAPVPGFALSVMGADYGALHPTLGKTLSLPWPEGALVVRMTHARYEALVVVIPREALTEQVRVAPTREELVMRPVVMPRA